MRQWAWGLAAALFLLAASRAEADFHIRYPSDIGEGEFEFEHNGAAQFDRLPSNSGAQSYTLEFGTGLTHWWHTAVEIAANRNAGFNEPLLVNGLVSENTFQFTEPGEYWADAALYIEYGQSLTRGKHAGPNELTFGPLIQKDIGRTTHTINLFLTRQLGPDQTTQGMDFSYAWQSRWNIWEKLSPAVEIYGDAGVLGHVPRLARQQILVGPVGVGQVRLSTLGLGPAGKVKYEIGWLFGATQASPQGTLRWRVEVEVPF
ncbi:MAG TPA: hypothetical protein VE690_04190 [Rhodopila sp.]|nr:hypothetical protein [Rhodopila sp.]